jgi:branched-subunit amino acid transport protein
VTTVLALAGAVVVSWFLRVLVVTLVPVSRLPERVQRTLPDVGPVVLAALVASSLLGGHAVPDVSLVAGASVTGLVVWRTRRVGLATVAGLATTALFQLL